MPDRPGFRHIREGGTDSYVLWAVMLAALVAILLLFGWPVFNAGKISVDVNKTQPKTELPATGDNKQP